MEKHELVRSTLLIVVLIVIAVVIAQSRRNCEVPGSSWVPCASLKPIWQDLKARGWIKANPQPKREDRQSGKPQTPLSVLSWSAKCQKRIFAAASISRSLL
jgi:hypothetical protein